MIGLGRVEYRCFFRPELILGSNRGMSLGRTRIPSAERNSDGVMPRLSLILVPPIRGPQRTPAEAMIAMYRDAGRTRGSNANFSRNGAVGIWSRTANLKPVLRLVESRVGMTNLVDSRIVIVAERMNPVFWNQGRAGEAL